MVGTVNFFQNRHYLLRLLKLSELLGVLLDLDTCGSLTVLSLTKNKAGVTTNKVLVINHRNTFPAGLLCRRKNIPEYNDRPKFRLCLWIKLPHKIKFIFQKRLKHSKKMHHQCLFNSPHRQPLHGKLFIQYIH